MKEYPILIGRDFDGSYLRFPGSEPIALHARTSSGKSVGFSLPNAFNYSGSMVCLDVKGELFNLTAGHRAHVLGQEVYRFSPTSGDGRSHCWNPFAIVDRDAPSRFREIARLAAQLFPDEHQVGTGGNNQQFWEAAGRQALGAIATLLAETPGSGFLTMDNIASLFLRSDAHEWLTGLINQSRARGDFYSAAVVEGISNYVGADMKLHNDIRTTGSTRMNLWSYPEIAGVTARSDFDLRDLRRKKMTIYVCVSPGMLQTLRPLLRLFFDQLVALNSDVMPEHDPTLQHQTLLLLDEFVRLGRLDALAQWSQYARGYGFRLAYVLQNKAQARAIYGDHAAADIFDNVGAEIIFGTNDPATTKELQERMGDNTVSYDTTSRPRFWSWLSWNKQHTNQHIQARPLMLDQEVMQMSPAEQLILRAGMKPVRSQRICWHNDPHFMHLVRPPPEVPRVPVIVRMDDGSVRMPQRLAGIRALGR